MTLTQQRDMTEAKMDTKTLEALKASIAKWERNVEALSSADVKLDADDCPLCDMFYHLECQGCPVSEKAGEIHCGSTPYTSALIAFQGWESLGDRPSRFRVTAQAEVDFLKSLLPEEA